MTSTRSMDLKPQNTCLPPGRSNLKPQNVKCALFQETLKHFKLSVLLFCPLMCGKWVVEGIDLNLDAKYF
jgi:hypothetical protein